VLDVGLPNLDGLELQKKLAGRTELSIIFITGNGDVPMTVQAMEAGAVEFLTKPFDGDVLLDAIRPAIERSREALQRGSGLQALQERYAALTPRERDVMALVASGLLNKEVGGQLGIGEGTVKAHRGVRGVLPPLRVRSHDPDFGGNGAGPHPSGRPPGVRCSVQGVLPRGGVRPRLSDRYQ
jgi:FixJ family two-component response regulator